MTKTVISPRSLDNVYDELKLLNMLLTELADLRAMADGEGEHQHPVHKFKGTETVSLRWLHLDPKPPPSLHLLILHIDTLPIAGIQREPFAEDILRALSRNGTDRVASPL